jgi:hypothetical protein
VAAVIFRWPAAPFIWGKDVSIEKGAMPRADADQDIAPPTVLPPPEAKSPPRPRSARRSFPRRLHACIM